MESTVEEFYKYNSLQDYLEAGDLVEKISEKLIEM